MKKYYKCRKDTGEILARMSTNMDVTEQISDDEKLVSYTENFLIDPKTMFHDNTTNKLQPRPIIEYQNTISISLGEIINIDYLPEFTKVLLENDQIGIITDGTLELTIPVSGIYTLKLEPPFPYVEKEIQVEVL